MNNREVTLEQQNAEILKELELLRQNNKNLIEVSVQQIQNIFTLLVCFVGKTIYRDRKNGRTESNVSNIILQYVLWIVW